MQIFVVAVRSAWTALVATVLLSATANAAAAEETPTPSPAPARQALTDAWWTGPMLAAGAGTLPHGHVLIEPYIYDVIKYGHYDANGGRTGATHENAFGSLTYMLYGLTDRVTVGLIPTFGVNTVTGGPGSSGIGVGDLSVLGQYRLTQYRLGSWIPTSSIVVQESLPTGRYDRLGSNPSNGFGSGAYTTTVSFYTQTYFWMPNGRILRMRINTSDAFSGSAHVDGTSVYGTPANFHGTAAPGSAFYVDLSEEYSMTRNWVLAFDALYRHDKNTHVSGIGARFDSGASDTYAFAPAVEYNWSPNVGVLLGVRLIPAGRNTSATITPAIAINIVR